MRAADAAIELEYERTEVHRPNGAKPKGDASKKRPGPLEGSTTGILCVDHDLGTCVCANPRDQVGKDDELEDAKRTARERG